MQDLLFDVPFSLGYPGVLRTAQGIDELPEAIRYTIDFSQSQHFEPFGMLLLASAIRRLKGRMSTTGEPADVAIAGVDLDRQGHAYAHEMGFWWSMGVGPEPVGVGPRSSDRYVRITRQGIPELYAQTGGYDPVRGELVRSIAEELATTLTNGDRSSVLWKTLQYSFEETLRNVVEHAACTSLWYAAASRPQADDVQVAVLDSGRGIRASLADCSQYRYADDLAAIRSSLVPGVSRNAGKKRTSRQTARLMEQFPGQDPALYDNHGMGLTMISDLGKAAGQFALVSGEAALAYVGAAEAVSHASHVGTAVRVVLRPSQLPAALSRVFNTHYSRERRKIGSRALISASMMARLGISPGQNDGAPNDGE